ncbi:MAG: hypothetical protein JST65_18735 [Acidobacteria bacterium]|nr:hypothetical protein [Acidobacteriota bacterium]
MRLVSKFLLLAAFTVPTFADVVGFYGGDIDVTNPNGLSNETTATVGGSPTGGSVYQAFVVPTGGWTVTGLFSNNLLDFTPTSAYWEIRSGVSAGNGGTLLHSGTATAPGFAATGRSAFGYTESTVSVSGLSLTLAPGTYWLTVTPQDAGAQARSFMSSTAGLNSIGPVLQNVAYFTSSHFGANFSNANDWSLTPLSAFSAGVNINAPSSVPEPAEISFLLLGTTGIAVSVRRRFRR